jgi:hypothetical protein
MEGERRLAAGTPARLSSAEGRKFGLLVGGAFLVLGLVLRWRGHVTAAAVAGGLGAALVLGGLVLPTRLGLVHRGWMGLAHLISRVTNPVFMGVVFFLVFTPAGLLARLFGHRPLSRSPAAASYWHSRAAGETRGHMDHQF